MRSTEDKLIHIPCTQGMDQSQSKHIAPIGTFYLAYNARISGRSIVEKRPGHAALSNLTVQSTSRSITGDGVTTYVEQAAFCTMVGNTLLVGNAAGDAYALGQRWQYQGSMSSCLPVKKHYGLVGTDLSKGTASFGKACPAIATFGDYVCVAAVDAVGNGYIHLEYKGILIWSSGEAASAGLTGITQIQAVTVNSVFYVVFDIGIGLWFLAITPAAAGVTVAAAVKIRDRSAPGLPWDTSADPDDTKWYVANNSAGSVRIDRFSGSTSTANVSFAVTGNGPVSLWARSSLDQIWVGWIENPGAAGVPSYRVYTAALGVTLGQTAIAGVPAATNAGPPMFGARRTFDGVVNDLTCAFFALSQPENGGGVERGIYVGTVNTVGATLSVSRRFGSLIAISKPDNYQRVWCLVSSISGNALVSRVALLRFPQGYNTTLWEIPRVELASPSMPAWLFTASTIGGQYFHAVASQPTNTTRQSYYFAFPYVLTTTSDDPLGVSVSYPLIKIEVYEYAPSHLYPHKDTERVGVSAIVAGSPYEFYGQPASEVGVGGTVLTGVAGSAELGFLQSPTILQLTQATGGSGNIGVGTFKYKAVYEWTDLYGRRHRSAPSPPVSITVAASGTTVTARVSTTDASQRITSNNSGLYPNIILYRTVANGEKYQRTIAQASALSPSANCYVSIADTTSDVAAAANEILYTDGGVLPDDLAPSCRFMAKAEDRLWFGGLWDPSIIQCSKIIIPGEPIQCSDHASHQVALPGECTGLSYMDGQVIAFTLDAIYLVSGDGPNDQGIGSFQEPRALTRSIGCIEYRSVVETNIGVMFQAQLGFYLIPRGFGSPVYVGAMIQDDFGVLANSGASPIVLGAISHLTRGNHLARFLIGLDVNAPSAFQVATYDLDSNAWFFDFLNANNNPGSGLLSEIGVLDEGTRTGKKGAVFVCNAPTTSRTFAVVEDETVSTEFGLDYQLQVQTAWLRPFGLGGWGKFKRVIVAVEVIASVELEIFARVDDNPLQTVTWVLLESGFVQYRELNFSVQAGSAAQVTVTETGAQPSSNWKIVSITLEIEPSGGARLMSNSERM